MTRVYAVEEGTGRRFLARIECDYSDCANSIAPGPGIAGSGWVKFGRYVPGDRGSGIEWDYCDDHSHHAPASQEPEP